MLNIKDLVAYVEEKEILKGFNLDVKPGEIHAIMGPNGAGKSTLAKLLAGHPSYEASCGSVTFNGENLLDMEPEERAQKGLFMSFQYPPEIEGVSTEQFLFSSVNASLKARQESEMSFDQFYALMNEKMKELLMDDRFKNRNVNEGFSGGEKKRNEILQMVLLNPKVAILDETDSGLDIDALSQVAKGIKTFANKDNAVVLITHYQRLLDYVKPDYVHVMVDGKIVHQGDASLARELEAKGYDWLISPQTES